MNILAIETSCEQGSVALLCGDMLVAREIDGHANHSERILPLIRLLLEEAGLAVGRLDAIAFGSGPGAFTGLRLACGLAQGLALGAGLGVAAVGSLEALAMQAEERRILAATNARMGEIYQAAYRRDDADGELVELAVPTCRRPEEFELPDNGEWVGLGSAFAAYGEALAQRAGARLCRVLPAAVPRAEEVARLALVRARRGGLLAPELAAPLYVRDKVAFTTTERLARGGKA